MRLAVFNLELQEGLEESLFTGLDADPFDEAQIIYSWGCPPATSWGRIASKQEAQQRRTWMLREQEFNFRPFEPIRSELIDEGSGLVCIASIEI